MVLPSSFLPPERAEPSFEKSVSFLRSGAGPWRAGGSAAPAVFLFPFRAGPRCDSHLLRFLPKRVGSPYNSQHRMDLIVGYLLLVVLELVGVPRVCCFVRAVISYRVNTKSTGWSMSSEGRAAAARNRPGARKAPARARLFRFSPLRRRWGKELSGSGRI